MNDTILYYWIAISGFFWTLLCAQTVIAQEWQRFEFSEPKMGTSFRIICYAGSEQLAQEAARAAFDRVDELNLIFSDYRDDSEVSRLSATAGSGAKVAVSAELWEVLSFSARLSRKTRGAFDVTVGPLSKLWRRAFRRGEFPDLELVREATEQTDYRKMKLYRRGRRVKLSTAGMRLDLGGIAKGYTVDAVYRVLQAHGIDRALVDGGGDIYAGDPPPGESGWEVQLASSDETAEAYSIRIANRAVAGSGSTYRYLEWDGVRYSHIIDPRTGLGVTETSIINVAAGDCMTADAFASALSVLNELERSHLLDQFPDIALLR